MHVIRPSIPNGRQKADNLHSLPENACRCRQRAVSSRLPARRPGQRPSARHASTNGKTFENRLHSRILVGRLVLRSPGATHRKGSGPSDKGMTMDAILGLINSLLATLLGLLGGIGG